MQAATSRHCERHHDFIGVRRIEELGSHSVVMRWHIQSILVGQRNIEFSAGYAAFAGIKRMAKRVLSV